MFQIGASLYAVGRPVRKRNDEDGQIGTIQSLPLERGALFNIPLSDWSASTSLATDHLPIIITMNSELSTIDGPRRIYINFKKADWARYAEACDKYIAEAGEPRTVEQAEKTFRKAVNKDSGLFIPAGRIQHFQPTLSAAFDTSNQPCRTHSTLPTNPAGRIQHFLPTLPASAKLHADERDRKRGLNPSDEALNNVNRSNNWCWTICEPNGNPPSTNATIQQAQLCQVFSTVFAWSLKDGIVPGVWKTSMICPIPKNNSPSDLSDYRPIAITSVVIKCFEKIVLHHLLDPTKGMQDPYQFAYRPNRSIKDAILTLLHNTFLHTNNPKSYVRILLADFSSAFNIIKPYHLAK